jgi:CBS-domain-containing membrane protein
MKASDVMVRNVITTRPQASVSRVAKQLVDNDVSALPVADDASRVVGIISEADLMRREELMAKELRNLCRTTWSRRPKTPDLERRKTCRRREPIEPSSSVRLGQVRGGHCGTDRSYASS